MVHTRQFHLATIEPLIRKLRMHDSRLMIEFENGMGIDFWILPDNALEMSFGDPKRALWGCGGVNPRVGVIAVKAAAADEHLRDVLRGINTEIEYFHAPSSPTSPPG